MMIRNRRADTGIEWTKRIVETIAIDFSREEKELYDAVALCAEQGRANVFRDDTRTRSLQQQRGGLLHIKKHAQ